MKPIKWLRVEDAADDPSVVDLYFFGIIGDWIDDLWGFDSVKTAKSFTDELAKIPSSVKTLRVHVNSPGGDVFGAVAIANALRDQRTSKGRSVEAYVDGLAASSASIIIQAGDPIRIGDNAMIMIHDPWTVAVGNAQELRKAAGELEAIANASLVTTYQWHSTLSDEEIVALMAATSWFNADEAIANGFATEKVEGLKAAAAIDPRAVAALKVPERFRAAVAALVQPCAAADPLPEPGQPAPEPPSPPPAAEVLRRCRAAGCLDLAEGFLETGAPLADVDAALVTARETRARAEARATEIRTLCQVAHCPELADGYLAGHMPAAAVRDHLTRITAKLHAVDIDGSLGPDAGAPRSTPRIDVVAIYADRNRLTKKE